MKEGRDILILGLGDFLVFLVKAMIFLDKKTVASIILASILYPICTYLTENITSVICLNYNDVLLIAILSGVVSGITNGIAFRYGYATGGIGVLAPIISKYMKSSISVVNFVVNTITLSSVVFFFIFVILLENIKSSFCKIISFTFLLSAACSLSSNNVFK